MSDPVESSTPHPKPKRQFFSRSSNNSVTRAQVLGLDRLEQLLGYFAAVVALVSGALVLPKFLSGKTTYLTETLKPSKLHTCTSGYHLVASLCEKSVAQTHGYWGEFLFIYTVAALLMAFAAWRRNRPMLATVALLFGLLTGFAGILFLALGAWLMLRAWRLQRYGTPTMRGSNAVARERARSRQPRRRQAEDASPSLKAPEPSKRYTPKKGTRR